MNDKNAKFVPIDFAVDKLLKKSSERRPSLQPTKSLIVKDV